mmetsp:Transcript_117565/g.230651  ORF Transcript_117565/g.230651 Transcript_117565/m.230651 type:complete len:322 (-) Transcript_117565:88-1053(-)
MFPSNSPAKGSVMLVGQCWNRRSMILLLDSCLAATTARPRNSSMMQLMWVTGDAAMYSCRKRLPRAEPAMSHTLPRKSLRGGESAATAVEPSILCAILTPSHELASRNARDEMLSMFTRSCKRFTYPANCMNLCLTTPRSGHVSTSASLKAVWTGTHGNIVDDCASARGAMTWHMLGSEFLRPAGKISKKEGPCDAAAFGSGWYCRQRRLTIVNALRRSMSMSATSWVQFLSNDDSLPLANACAGEAMSCGSSNGAHTLDSCASPSLLPTSVISSQHGKGPALTLTILEASEPKSFAAILSSLVSAQPGRLLSKMPSTQPA